MRVLFSMLSEPGHHMGTFRLARALTSRGHDVAYLGLPRVRRLVQDQGFEFFEFAGAVLARSDAEANATRSWWRKRSEAEAVFARFAAALVDGTLDDCLREARPDVVICDAFVWYVALRSLRLGIPTIQISTSLFLFDNPCIPPAIMPITPRNGTLSRLRVLAAWKWMHVRFFVTKRVASRLTGVYRDPARMHHLVDTFRWVAKHSGFRCQLNSTYVKDEIGAHLILPEIVLCTRTFQFPGELPANRQYCGEFIDFDRTESPLPFDPRNRKIVLCSLGTSAGAYRQAGRFFRVVAEASRLAPHWFFVLHVSDPRLIKDHQSTENLLVVDWLPQLATLRHASVMVNHGGLNSIMECVGNEVPMIILPCARDQPGNAARAAFHRVALTAKIETVTAAGLTTLIAKAVNDPAIRAGLKKMRRAIEGSGDLERVVGFVERVPVRSESEFDLDSPRQPPLHHSG